MVWNFGANARILIRTCMTVRLVLALLLGLIEHANAGQPVIRIFTTEDGLARNWVKRVRRDHLGRLWFCTVEGLSVFDGERFTNYTVADGLPNRYVSDFADTGDGAYWILTPAGLYRLEPRGGPARSFRPVFTKVPLAGAADPTEYSGPGEALFFQGRSGETWIATGGGLF